MITYKQIKEVNETLPRIDVKGKQYAMVPARVAAFRQICPNGSIQTEIIDLTDGVVTMKTTVLDEEGRILGTGFAQEKESSSYINKTSFVENCETSAVGRALGFLGLGSESSMASAEEMVNALSNQSQKSYTKQEELKAEAEYNKVRESTIDNTKIVALTNAAHDAGVTLEQILKQYSINTLGEMTEAMFLDCTARIRKVQEKQSKAAKA